VLWKAVEERGTISFHHRQGISAKAVRSRERALDRGRADRGELRRGAAVAAVDAGLDVAVAIPARRQSRGPGVDDDEELSGGAQRAGLCRSGHQQPVDRGRGGDRDHGDYLPRRLDRGPEWTRWTLPRSARDAVSRVSGNLPWCRRHGGLAARAAAG